MRQGGKIWRMVKDGCGKGLGMYFWRISECGGVNDDQLVRQGGLFIVQNPSKSARKKD